MKFLAAQLAYFLSVHETRRNTVALLRYLAFVAAVIALYSVVFHLIMLAEGHDHSWVTGLYWTLTVMTTLGFGDITFASDVGRMFSMLVLLSGVVLLLIVLPFTFIRLFFAPWLETQVRLRAPRGVPPEVRDHVIVCAWDAIAPGLVQHLRTHGSECFVIEPDPVVAARLHGEGFPVVTGEIDARETYERLQVGQSRLVLANRSDAVNTNVVLTVRELAPQVAIAATAEDEDAIDILELSGATYVLPLKRRLGEMLVHRINTGHAQAHVLGTFQGLLVAEFPIHGTALAGKTIRESRLREVVGVNFVGVWERGRLLPVHAETPLTTTSMPVVVGTAAQIEELNTILVIYDVNYNPALVIGGGKVGQAAVRELRRREFPVHLVERDPAACAMMADTANRVIHGDAADRAVLLDAGIGEAPSVLLTTNDDATNIYLTVYCRRLNPELRIVSRITHERNLEAISRAGADLVLSYAALGVEHVFSLVRGREFLPLGGDLELFALPVPPALRGRTLEASGIGERTGLNVIAFQVRDKTVTNLTPATALPSEGDLIMLGNPAQLERFREIFGCGGSSVGARKPTRGSRP